MHSVFGSRKYFSSSSSPETFICWSRKNRANHRDQKRTQSQKKKETLFFFSIHSTRTHFDGTVSSGGVE
jgi:hypothetical protein